MTESDTLEQLRDNLDWSSRVPWVLGENRRNTNDEDRQADATEQNEPDSWLDESLRDIGTPADSADGTEPDVEQQDGQLRIRISKTVCENCGQTVIRNHHEGCASPIVYIGDHWRCGHCNLKASATVSCGNCGATVDRQPESVGMDLSLSFEGVAVERAIHQETNRKRAAHGEGELEYSEHLSAIALQHSRAMAQEDFFDHTGPGGSEVTDRYREFGHDTERSGENLALVYPERSASPTEAAQVVVDNWMDSPGHREALLTGAFEEEGIGVYLDATGALYATQNFY